MADDTKACPLCGETIKAVAVKCRFCGTMLDSTTIGGQQQAVPASIQPVPNHKGLSVLRRRGALVAVAIGTVLVLLAVALYIVFAANTVPKEGQSVVQTIPLRQNTPPVTRFTTVGLPGEYTCGLMTDGTVTCWGTGVPGNSPPPSHYVQAPSPREPSPPSIPRAA